MVVQEIVRAWFEYFPDDELTLAVRKSDAARAAKLYPSARVIPLAFKPHAVAVSIELPLKVGGGWRLVTQNFTPVFRKSTVFIHDAIFKSNPEWFTVMERAYLELMVPLSRFADAKVTSSRTESERVRRLFPGDTKVKAVGLALSTSLRNAVERRPSGFANSDFILSVGRLNVRKNLSTLIRAAATSSTISESCPLVVVGEASGRQMADNAELKNMVARKELILLGHVPDAELKWLYTHARALAFLSLDEGYGLPPLEAASFGTGSILSDIPVFRELYPHAVFVDPRNVESARNALDATRRRSGESIKSSDGAASDGWLEIVGAIRDASMKGMP